VSLGRPWGFGTNFVTVVLGLNSGLVLITWSVRSKKNLS